MAQSDAAGSLIMVKWLACFIAKLRICDSSMPFQFLSLAVARVILARFWLTTQYSVASSENQADDKRAKGSLFPGIPASTGQLDNNMRDGLFRTSIELLEVSGMLLTNKDITKWTWYSTTHPVGRNGICTFRTMRPASLSRVRSRVGLRHDRV
ncbi:hypothetical protein PENSOL_c009G10341 [Penicillium solitum]|uniref:Uncharacterized protein n=1 Tax=Penicillium solitum TaxID=60172 RepID=A0A1V6RB61_9EURO|nr:uncharacterized protein PENSOL_c009G10341 [Penicillium solitum]OQD98456.1 hypothetical protein PENSOL_c009G10341 [Penicillium solitum]